MNVFLRLLIFPLPHLVTGSPFLPPLSKEYFPTGNELSQTPVGSPQKNRLLLLLFFSRRFKISTKHSRLFKISTKHFLSEKPKEVHKKFSPRCAR